MFKDLIIQLRQRNYAEVKKILAQNPLYALSIDEQQWINSNEGRIDPEFAGSLPVTQSQTYILAKTISEHVHTPDLIHAFLVAGCSPFIIATAFYKDPYRLSMLMRLLPLLDVKEPYPQSLEERIKDGVASIDDQRIYALNDVINHQVPSYPINYQVNTYDLLQLLNNLLEGKQFRFLETSIDTHLEPMLATANRIRSDRNLPALTEDDEDYQIIAKRAKQIANLNVAKAMEHIFFCLEVYDVIKEQGIKLVNNESNSAVIRALKERYKTLEIHDGLILALAAIHLYVFSILISVTNKTEVYLIFSLIMLMSFSQFHASIQIQHAFASFTAEDYQNRRSLLWLYRCESFPFAAKSSSLFDDIRERHTNNITNMEQVPKQLYFWRKLFLSQSMAAADDPATPANQRPKLD